MTRKYLRINNLETVQESGLVSMGHLYRKPPTAGVVVT